MTSRYLAFARIRIFALTYTICVSILAFAIVLFVLPTDSRKHIVALTVIAIVSLIIAFVACLALLVPKTECCTRRAVTGRRGKVYVGVEILCSFASLLLLVTAIILETGLRSAHTDHTKQTWDSNRNAFTPGAEHALSALLLFLSCSTALVIMAYTSFIASLAVYTHKRTQGTNVWFSDVASMAPAFIFPPALRFLRTVEDEDESEADLETAGRRQRVRIEQLEPTPALRTLLRQIHSRVRSNHTPAPDCVCGEKLLWTPIHPDEYRSVGQIYSRVWTIIAEREAQERARTLGRGAGHQRSWSAPVPILRLPTDRERRRTVFLVAFDAARIGH